MWVIKPFKQLISTFTGVITLYITTKNTCQLNVATIVFVLTTLIIICTYTYSQETRFSKCDVCTAIKEGRERTLNSSVRKWLCEILEKHISLEKLGLTHLKYT